MKIDKEKLIEIISSDISDGTSFLVGFRILQKYANITLENDDNNDVYHRANIDEILSHNINEEDLVSIKSSGWKLDNKSENIVKYFI